MKNLVNWLLKQDRAAAVDFAELAAEVRALSQQVQFMAGGLVGVETVLELCGLLTPERLEQVKALMQARMSAGQAGEKQEAPAETTPAAEQRIIVP